MTLKEACRLLADLHTRPSNEFGVVIANRPVPRGMEDQYIEAWATVSAFANELQSVSG